MIGALRHEGGKMSGSSILLLAWTVSVRDTDERDWADAGVPLVEP